MPCAVSAARALPEEPLFGSYFVAAYPPFSCWTERAVESYRERLATAAPERPGFGLYVHVPFCVKRCDYCYYLSYDDRAAEVERYLAALAREAELYARAPYLAGRRLDFVYFGGGTPSLLPAARVRELLGALQRVFPWTEVREASFECAPRTATADRLAALRELGITRVSLGVQQLDDDVLRASGRIHLVEDVERAWAAIRRLEFEVVNVDLIVGLPGETEASWRASLDWAIERAPEMVTLYQLEIPENTPLYRQLRADSAALRPTAWEGKHERLAAAFERLETAGYTAVSGYAAVRDPERHRFLYQEEQYRGADLLGLGAGSFSYLGGAHQQNRATLDGYLEDLDARRLPLGRAHALSDEERLVREFVLQLKLARVDLGALAAKFGRDPLGPFGASLEPFREAGWLEVAADAVTLTRAGRVRVDRMLPALYLPRHRGARYS